MGSHYRQFPGLPTLWCSGKGPHPVLLRLQANQSGLPLVAFQSVCTRTQDCAQLFPPNCYTNGHGLAIITEPGLILCIMAMYIFKSQSR